MNQLAVPSLAISGEKGTITATNRHVAQPGSALSWGVRGRRFKSSRADQIIILDVSDTYGNPTKTRIITEYAGFLLPEYIGIDCLQPDFLVIRLAIRQAYS